MKRIGIYVGKNLLRIILLLFAVSILTFALVSASPIDPLQANVGQAALGSMSEEQKEKLRSYWGVDEPPVQRYLNWLNAFIKGDGGISLLYRQPVTKMEIEKIRGVSSDHAVNKLVEYHLVCELGRLDAPGRPLLFGTTEEFLRSFGVHSIDDLPVLSPVQVEEFKQEAEEEMHVKLDV